MRRVSHALLLFAVRFYTRTHPQSPVMHNIYSGKVTLPRETLEVDNGHRRVNVTLQYGPLLFGKYPRRSA